MCWGPKTKDVQNLWEVRDAECAVCEGSSLSCSLAMAEGWRSDPIPGLAAASNGF